MKGCRPLLCGTLLLFLLAGCATSSVDQSESDGSGGMDRVSPVRAAEINTRLGVGYLQRDDLKLAVEKLERAIELDPQHVPAYVTMALVRQRLGQESLARKHYQRAAELAPADGATLNAYAAFLCRSGEFSRAQTYFDRALNDPFYRTPEVIHTNAGACALRNGEHDQALQQLRAALDANENYPDALFQLARAYLARGEAFRARAFLQRYEDAAGADAATLALGYRIERDLGNEGESARYKQRLESEFPDSEEARNLRRSSSQND